MNAPALDRYPTAEHEVMDREYVLPPHDGKRDASRPAATRSNRAPGERGTQHMIFRLRQKATPWIPYAAAGLLVYVVLLR